MQSAATNSTPPDVRPRRARRASRVTAALALIAAITVVPSGPATAIFDDVAPGSYYADAVQWMHDQGITTGTSSSTFSPGDDVSRGSFATFLWRLAGEPSRRGSNSFADVADDAFYREAVEWMADEGITTGRSPWSFAPEASLTRAEAATFLWRYAGEPDGSAGFDFADVGPGSFAHEAVRWMAGEGITTGTSPWAFSPDAAISRAEAATFLYRFAVGAPGSIGRLSWSPPAGWQGYDRVNVPDDGGSIRLGWDQDVVLVMPDGPVRGTVFVQGGRNVVMIGGEVRIDSPGPYHSASMGLRFKDQRGTIFVEGVYMTGPALTEGIQLDAPDAEAVLQNIRIDTLVGSADENHADLVQPWGSLESLRIDGLTGSSRYQGFMFKADQDAPLGPVLIRRVNITMVEGPAGDEHFPNNGGRYSIWFDPGDKTSTVHLDSGTVWVDTNSQYKGGDLSQTVWPHTSRTGSDQLGSWIEFESSEITGRVHSGRPPAGDYVRPGSAGLGYRSPGYVS